MTKDVEVDSNTVYDWHTVLHLQLYFQGHTGESSVPGMTSLFHCRCNGVFTPKQENDKTNVEPVHSYDAFHTWFVGPCERPHRNAQVQHLSCCSLVVVLLWCENTITLSVTLFVTLCFCNFVTLAETI